MILSAWEKLLRDQTATKTLCKRRRDMEELRNTRKLWKVSWWWGKSDEEYWITRLLSLESSRVSAVRRVWEEERIRSKLQWRARVDGFKRVAHIRVSPVQETNKKKVGQGDTWRLLDLQAAFGWICDGILDYKTKKTREHNETQSNPIT